MSNFKAAGPGYRLFQVLYKETVLAEVQVNRQRVRMRGIIPPTSWQDSYIQSLRDDILMGLIARPALEMLGLCVLMQWPDDIQLKEVSL